MPEHTHRIRLRPHPKHYVYVHFHPHHPGDEKHVVYVGKGVDSRAWSRYARQPGHRYWLRDWQNLGYTPGQFVKVVKRGMTEQQARRCEKSLITYYLRRGCSLFNRERGQNPAQKRTYKPWFTQPQ